jgi:hypothetical protein
LKHSRNSQVIAQHLTVQRVLIIERSSENDSMAAPAVIGNRQTSALFTVLADPARYLYTLFSTAILPPATGTPFFTVIPSADIFARASSAGDFVMHINRSASGFNRLDIANIFSACS